MPSSPKAKSPKKRRIGLIVFLFLTGILCVLGLTVGSWSYRLLAAIGGKGGAQEAWNGIVRPRDQFPAKDKVTVLVVGKDYSYTNKDIRYTKDSRSDTLILMTLNLNDKTVTGISIPRDSYIPSLRGKINGAFRRGIESTRKVVGELLGVAPDYYIVLKPDTVKEIVDLVGGVEVEAKDRMVYNDRWAHLHINLPEGKQTITGEQAMGFVRYREPDQYERNPDLSPKLDRNNLPIKRRHLEFSKEDGDDRRMARQQMLIKAVAQKAKQPENLWRADKLLDSALGVIETDLSRTQLLAVATLFRTIQPTEIQTAILPGEGEKIRSREYGHIWVFQPDLRKTKLMVDWLVNGNEAAAYAMTTVKVENHAGVIGAARKAAEILRDKGFDASVVNGKTMPDAPTTRIVYGKASVAARAQRVAQLLGGGVLVKDATLLPNGDTDKNGFGNSDATDIAVLLGKDLAESFGKTPIQSAKL